jgi:hypothetical protein
MKRIIIYTLLILLFFSAMTTVEATDSSSTTDGDNNGDGAEDSSSTPSPTDTNSEQKRWFDKIIDWIINSLFKSFGEVAYEDVKDSTEKMKNEGLFKEEKSDQDQKSGEPENQKEAYKVEIKPLGEGELGYEDGEKDASASMGGDGHAVFFPIGTPLIVRQVKIYGCRYDDGLKQFNIEIWDTDFRTLYSVSYNYVDYFPDSHSPFGDDDFKWTIIDIPDIEAHNDFYLVLFTHSSPPSWGEKEEYERVPPHMQGGIEIGVDKDMKSGNSFVVDKNPNRIVDWPTWNLQQDSSDWMIRVSSG